MGEAVDLMLEGITCQSCGVLIESDAPGHPRCCPDCERHVDRVVERRTADRSARRAQATAEWHELARLAEQHGLRLVRHTEAHYQVFPADKAWILNIYPGNCRLYHDRNTPKIPPYLRGFSGRKWSLREVVEEVIRLTREKA